MGRLLKFKRDEDGAVSVDWVLLTASIAMLATSVSLLISSSSVDLADNLGIYMDNQDPN